MTPRDVVEVVQRILGRAVGWVSDDPRLGPKALAWAEWEEGGGAVPDPRDRGRGVGRGIGTGYVPVFAASRAHNRELLGVGQQFASWLVKRCTRTYDAAGYRRALEASLAHRDADPLAQELWDFVEGYLAGEVSDSEFVRRWKKAKPDGPDSSARMNVVEPAGAVRADRAAADLREALRSSGVEMRAADPARVWEAVKRCTAKPIVGVPRGAVEDDMSFVEWGPPSEGAGTADWVAFEVVFTRQLSLVDAEGDQDRMVHVSCELQYAHRVDEWQAGPGVVDWSAAGAVGWFEDVEASLLIERLGRLHERPAVNVFQTTV